MLRGLDKNRARLVDPVGVIVPPPRLSHCSKKR